MTWEKYVFIPIAHILFGWLIVFGILEILAGVYAMGDEAGVKTLDAYERIWVIFMGTLIISPHILLNFRYRSI